MRRSGVWAATAICCVAAAAGVFAGCGSTQSEESTISEEKKQIVDDFAAMTLLMDQDSAAYDLVLETVGAYAQSWSEEDLAAARESIAQTTESFEEISASITEYEMTDEFAEILSDAGINAEEYLYYTEERAYMLSYYITQMEYLDTYLGWLEESDVIADDFEFMYEFEVADQEILQQYYYWTINYWFAGWTEEEVAYVQETIHANLTSFQSDTDEWDDDAESVETRIYALLEQQEVLLDEMSEHLGESQEELYELMQELEEE